VGFYEKLNQLGVNLTPNEIKLCSLLRLNLTSKEIAIITYRSISTVETNRSTLRKKLNLASDENLISFLLAL
jgi:DNA-binding CsgD family transcriptional regulator